MLAIFKQRPFYFSGEQTFAGLKRCVSLGGSFMTSVCPAAGKTSKVWAGSKLSVSTALLTFWWVAKHIHLSMYLPISKIVNCSWIPWAGKGMGPEALPTLAGSQAWTRAASGHPDLLRAFKASLSPVDSSSLVERPFILETVPPHLELFPSLLLLEYPGRV